MKHFANYADIYPESVVSSINTTTGVVTTSDASEPDRVYSFTNLILAENPAVENGNTYYEQNLRVVSSVKLTAAQRVKYANRRTVVVVLYADDQTPIVWGDKTEKARMLITPNLENEVLTISRQSINAVL